jgi:hypothetical protein
MPGYTKNPVAYNDPVDLAPIGDAPRILAPSSFAGVADQVLAG